MRRIPLGPEGLSMLPGHEEETFHPRINPRSRNVPRPEAESVYDRLYETATEAIEQRRAARLKYTRQFINTDVDVKGGIDMGVTFKRDILDHPPGAAAAAAATAHPVHAYDPLGASDSPSKKRVDRHAPTFINLVAYAPQWDFVVQRVLAAASESE